MFVIELRSGSYLGPYEDRGVPLAQAIRFPTEEAAETEASARGFMSAGAMAVTWASAFTALSRSARAD